MTLTCWVIIFLMMRKKKNLHLFNPHVDEMKIVWGLCSIYLESIHFLTEYQEPWRNEKSVIQVLCFGLCVETTDMTCDVTEMLFPPLSSWIYTHRVAWLGVDAYAETRSLTPTHKQFVSAFRPLPCGFAAVRAFQWIRPLRRLQAPADLRDVLDFQQRLWLVVFLQTFPHSRIPLHFLLEKQADYNEADVQHNHAWLFCDYHIICISFHPLVQFKTPDTIVCSCSGSRFMLQPIPAVIGWAAGYMFGRVTTSVHSHLHTYTGRARESHTEHRTVIAPLLTRPLDRIMLEKCGRLATSHLTENRPDYESSTGGSVKSSQSYSIASNHRS